MTNPLFPLYINVIFQQKYARANEHYLRASTCIDYCGILNAELSLYLQVFQRRPPRLHSLLRHKS